MDTALGCQWVHHHGADTGEPSGDVGKEPAGDVGGGPADCVSGGGGPGEVNRDFSISSEIMLASALSFICL